MIKSAEALLQATGIFQSCQTQQRLNVRIMRQRLKRVPEENQKVNFTFNYASTYLLVTALGPFQELSCSNLIPSP